MATIGGALVNGDPNQDPPPALIALGATVELTSSSGSRSCCPVEELYIDYYETDVRPGEVLTAVNVPVPMEDTFGSYLKFLSSYCRRLRHGVGRCGGVAPAGQHLP